MLPRLTLLATAAVAFAPLLPAQQPSTPQPPPRPPSSTQAAAPAAPVQPAVVLHVGDAAPDFALPAATRYGLLRDSVHLSDFRGKTVVVAFFFKARTKG